jgi:sec-independent protein translocase protein TatB
MFDIGFSELFLVAIVALVVIGPERLPGVARNIGRFAGRLQRYVHDIKRDFNREVEFEEIRRLQHEMETTVQSMQESMRVVESSLKKETLDQQTALLDAVAELDAAASTVVEAADVNPALGEPAAAEKPATPRKRAPRKTTKATAAPASPSPSVPTSAPPTSPSTAASADDEQFRLF